MIVRQIIIALVLDQTRAFARDGGTVLVATHDPAVAAAADRCLRLERGRLVNA